MAKKTGNKKDRDLVMVGGGADEENEREDLEEEEEEHEEEESSEKDDDEGEEEEDKSARKKKPKAKDQDEDEDGDSDEDDERVGHGEDDEEEGEDGKGKTRERESRKARRERQKRARRRNEIELNFLRGQNEQLERSVSELRSRVDKSEVGSIDQRIASIQSQIKVADQVFAKAVKSGEEEDITEATNIRDKLRDTLTRLNGAKVEMSRRAEESEEEPQIDSRLVHHASTWMKEHRWYDPNGNDKDSRRVAAIDDQLIRERFDPRTPEYWDELTERVEKALPHRFKDSRNGRGDDDDLEDDEERGSRKGGKAQGGRGPRFSTGGRERPLRKNEVYVDPERKKALIEAGVWDDKVLRNKYLKRYQQYDRENPRGRAR